MTPSLARSRAGEGQARDLGAAAADDVPAWPGACGAGRRLTFAPALGRLYMI